MTGTTKSRLISTIGLAVWAATVVAVPGRAVAAPPQEEPPPSDVAEPSQSAGEPSVEEIRESVEEIREDEPSAAQRDGENDTAVDGGDTTASEPDADPSEAEDVDFEAGDFAELLSEPVVGAASRRAESASDAPAISMVISRAQLQSHGIRTLDEAINYLSYGMFAQGGGSTTSVGARGFSVASDWGSHVAVLVDGHLSNDPSSGVAGLDRYAAFPIELIDHIEIVLGAGSVLYGQTAMLGVINIVTLDGDDINAVEFIADGSLTPSQTRSGAVEGFRRGEMGRRYRLGTRFGRGFDVGKKRIRLAGQIEWFDDRSPGFEVGPQYLPGAESLFDFGNTGTGESGKWGGREFSPTRGPNAYVTLRSGGLSLAYRGRNQTQRFPGFGLDFNDDSSRQSVTNNFVEARYDYAVGDKVHGFARLYGDHWLFKQQLGFRGATFCGSEEDAPCSIRFDSETIQGGAENGWNFDWFADGRYVTTIGADLRLRGWLYLLEGNAADGRTFDTLGERKALRVLDVATAGYAQQLAKVHPKITLNAGLRYDYYENTGGALSPRAAAIFSPWKGGTVKLIYAQAFRSAARTELFLAEGGRRLDNETVKTGEVVVEQAWGTHRLKVGGFGSVWENLVRQAIDDDPSSVSAPSYVNTDPVIQVGGTASYSAQVARLDYGLSTSYGWSRTDLGGLGRGDLPLSDERLARAGYRPEAVAAFGERQPLDANPEFTGNLHVAYDFGERLPTLGVAAFVFGPRVLASAYTDRTVIDASNGPSDVIVPFRAAVRFTASGIAREWQTLYLGYRVGAEININTKEPFSWGPFKVYQTGGTRPQIEFAQQPRFTMFGALTLGFKIGE